MQGWLGLISDAAQWTGRVVLSALLATGCTEPKAPSANTAGTTNQPGIIHIGGDYGPTQELHLLGEASCIAAGPIERRFVWRFDPGRFVMSAMGDSLPEEVVAQVLRVDRKVRTITGKWQLIDRTLLLSQLRADGKDGFSDMELRPFRTPVVRLNFGTTQYVLSKLPKVNEFSQMSKFPKATKLPAAGQQANPQR